LLLLLIFVSKESSIEEENELIYEDQIQYEDYSDREEESENENDDMFEKIIVGVCAMAKKVQSKPMEEILTRLKHYDHFEINIFAEESILNDPIEMWPKCDCLISFYSKDFPLKKAQEYAKMYNPFLINDLEKQWDIMDRIKVYQILKEAGIEQPRYAIKHEDEKDVIEQEDQIEIRGQVFNKPFVEKPINADDHNIYIYFPSSAGGGSQRLFRKVNIYSFFSYNNISILI
jgi:inositol-hexakisphosphate/diphosphoinositol-pentakisphosphate 1-kinase